jgi:hypothetical protein
MNHLSKLEGEINPVIVTNMPNNHSILLDKVGILFGIFIVIRFEHSNSKMRSFNSYYQTTFLIFLHLFPPLR